MTALSRDVAVTWVGAIVCVEAQLGSFEFKKVMSASSEV